VLLIPRPQPRAAG